MFSKLFKRGIKKTDIRGKFSAKTFTIDELTDDAMEQLNG